MQKILLVSAVLLFIAGGFMVVGGVGGIVYTHQSVRAEGITTSKDATIPRTPVRGPLTLKAQADVIRMHMLTNTGGKTFAQMPGTLPKLDEAGNPVLNAEGKAETIPNDLRATWFPAITLMTALQLGVLTYAFSLLSLVLGLLFVLNGYVFLVIRKG